MRTERLIDTSCDDFMVAAERELIVFERKERELRKQERLDRVKEKFPSPDKCTSELVIWNASSSHYMMSSNLDRGERLWRMQVREAGQSSRWY
jgi:hypothetical protein